MSVEFVNCFEVPAGREDEFLANWRTVHAYMAAKPGYEAHRLHRSLRPDARYRFVNIARWSSLEAWQQAHDEQFRFMVSAAEWRDFPSVPALYEIVHSGDAVGAVTSA